MHWLYLIVLIVACSDATKDPSANADADADGDTDSDTGSDTDSDTGSDTGADACDGRGEWSGRLGPGMDEMGVTVRIDADRTEIAYLDDKLWQTWGVLGGVALGVSDIGAEGDTFVACDPTSDG